VAVREFPALGFDPAPGDAAALSSAAADVTGAGTVFSDASAGIDESLAAHPLDPTEPAAGDVAAAVGTLRARA
jgi:hypothetical protein